MERLLAWTKTPPSKPLHLYGPSTQVQRENSCKGHVLREGEQKEWER